MKPIEGRAKTVRGLMDRAKYTIDFYQREYAWKERQVRELIDDLTGKFLDSYEAGHRRQDVRDYGHYFLGSIVISHKNAQRYIVDGQQRLTTLTLLLVHLHHLQADRDDRVDVRSLVYSEEYGSQSFNLDVPERNAVMGRLLRGEAPNTEGQAGSVGNIAERYQTLVGHMPEEVVGDALPFFVDWLLNHVHMVEIEAFSDEAAYTIFETMNDRGLSLSLPEMLKGYILANIDDERDQRHVNSLWKTHMQAFEALGTDEDVDFFKNWLRARHAESIRPGRKGAENQDYERIGSQFHRWVRDHRARLGLTQSNGSPSPAAFERFVTRELDFYARQARRIRAAAEAVTPGLEAIRYNEERGFTLQHQMLLAALSPDDAPDAVTTKLKLVADFIDIWLARRVWNFRTITYSSVRYRLFTLTRSVRGKALPALVQTLREHLDEQVERFATQPRLRLHKQNYRQIRHLLARLTHWVDTECGMASHFDDLVSAGRARPYEIEHIWANHFERHEDVFAGPAEFDIERNRIGGLLLLQRGLNQSLGDAPYEAKRTAYAVHSQNMLARSLDPAAYANHPAFARLRSRTGLEFEPYDHFGPDEQARRQLLYIRLAEWVWNPGRLTLGEVEPPVPEPLPETDRRAPAGMAPKGRQAFWVRLLDEARSRTALHDNVSPSHDSWVSAGAGRSGLTFNYNVTRGETRAELYFNTGSRDTNKALFDQLSTHRAAVDAAFGGPLSWERSDANITSRIACRIARGGWEDATTWDGAIPATIDAMIRLHAALGPYIPTLTQP